MKKTLLTLALCAASLMGTASANFILTQGKGEESGFWTLTGKGSYGDCYDLIQTTEGLGDDSIIRLGDIEGQQAEITFSKSDSTTYLPDVVMVQFVNASLKFEDIVALQPNPEATAGYGPAIVDYWTDFESFKSGNLTVSVETTAVENWLNEQESLDVKASFALVDNAATITHGDDSDVKFELINGEEVIAHGGEYVYQDKSLHEHTYTNVGVIWKEAQLLQNQIAILYKPGAISEDQEWGGAGFYVVALGDNYVPVPEPTTGSLSLLALAGLCARRRRK